MEGIGYYSELKWHTDNGSLKANIQKEADYDKSIVMQYIESFKKSAICARDTVDPISKRMICHTTEFYNDGEYEWSESLIYFIDKYNVKLPKGFVEKAISYVNQNI